MLLVSENFDFSGPLIIEPWNKCNCIQNDLNPNYVALKPFQSIFPSQNEQNVKFLPGFLIFQEPLIIETQNMCHWIWNGLNPKYAPLKPFQCIFPTQNQQNVKFLAVYWTSPDKKWKNMNLNMEKVFRKTWKSAHIGFWVCWSQCTMLELCVTSTFWVMMVILDLWQEGLDIRFWSMV